MMGLCLGGKDGRLSGVGFGRLCKLVGVVDYYDL
jgi:hypothetical protein